jgi:hypothetical protein
MIRNKLYRGQSVYDGFQYNPEKIDLQSWGGDHPVLPHCISVVKPQLIIEVGSWKGRSAIHMAHALKANGIQGEVLCVDTWLGSPEHWLASGSNQFWFDSLGITNGYPTLFNTFLTNVVSQGLQEYITPLPLPSETAYFVLKQLNVKAGMIYVDAGHEYESVYRDIKMYWELLEENGVMVLDDFNSWPGVSKAVYQFAHENDLFVWGEYGKAVLSKNKNLKVQSKITLG